MCISHKCTNIDTSILRFFVKFLVMDVPVCPPGPCSILAMHFRLHGWKWDEESLLEIVSQLVAEDIRDSNTLRGVLIDDIEAAACWSDEVREFVRKLCEVRLLHVVYIPFVPHLLCRQSHSQQIAATPRAS